MNPTETSQNPLSSFFQNVIFQHKLRTLISVAVILLLITFTTFVVTTRKSHTNITPNPSVFDNRLISIELLYQKGETPKISITSVSSKPTTMSASQILSSEWTGTNTENNFVLLLVDKDNKTLATQKFSLNGSIHADGPGLIGSSSVTVSALTNTQFLPSYTGSNKILLEDSNGKIIQSAKYASPKTTSKIQSLPPDEGSSTKTDIMFIPYNYSSSEIQNYKDTVQTLISNLKTLAPFSATSNIVYNVYDSPISDLTCQQANVLSYCLDCGVTWQAAKNALKAKFGTEGDHIVIVGKENARGGACAPGYQDVTIPSMESGETLAHELGHAVGKLHHSDIENDDGAPADTVDNTSTFAQCGKGKPIPDWKQIIPDTSYFAGCIYADWYRSANKSVMSNDGTIHSNTFSPVELWKMNEMLGIQNTPITGGTTPPGESCKTLQAGVVNKVSENTTFCSGTVQSNQSDAGVIQITADNITVDGGRVVIDGGNKSGNGITSDSHSGITIKNFTIKNFSKGIVATNGSNVTISNNDVSGNGSGTGGSQFTINVEITSTPGGGILLNNISGGHITNNIGKSQDIGLNLYNSSGNSITGNDFSNNNVWGIRLYASSQNTISGNSANHTNPCPSDCDSAGMVLVKGSNGNIISKNDLTYSGDGFFIGNEAGGPSNNNTISGNDGSNSPHNCFEATFSTGNTFSDNIAKNCNYGFWLGYSKNTSLTHNYIANNRNDGVMWTNGTPPGEFKNNTFSENTGWGINMTNNGDTRWTNSDPIPNLSAFPAGNTFYKNVQGNCKGSGFTDADKNGGKCSDSGSKPADPGNGDVGAQPGAGPGSGGGQPPTPTYSAPNKDGYCANGNGRDAHPHWANTTRAITCNFGTTHYANDKDANGYCAQTYSNNAPYFYECDPAQSGGGGTNPIDPIIICKDHKGVDGAAFPNGFVNSICMTGTPTASNYTDGLFSYSKAIATPNPYKDGTYYDVYKCIDSGTYDFIHSQGTENVCKSYPWVQDKSGTTPTPPPGQTCSNPNHPYWDGTKCTYRPDACNNVGPGGHQNTCQPSACGTALAPDTHAGPAEANTACREYYNNDPQKQFCCMQSSAPSAPGAPNPGSGSGGTTPPTGSGTETEYGHCYHGDSDCAPQYKCNRNPGDATSYCIYKNPSEPNAYCQSSSHYCSNSLTGCSQTGLLQGDNYSCQRAGLGTYCCNGSPGSGGVTPATSGCPHYTDSTGNPTTDSKSVCQATTSCPGGSRRGTAANDAACVASYPGDSSKIYCCIDNRVTNIASINTVSTNSCKKNSDCVLLGLGNSCVFTNNPNVGVCR